MNFALDENQVMIRATVERFAGAGDVNARQAQRAQPGRLDRARWTALAELGLLSLDDRVDCAVIAETLGRAAAVEPWLECGFWPLRLVRGNACAAGIADGSMRAAVAFAEPARGYALDPMTVAATQHGGQWRIGGTKTFVLGGGVADLFLVTAVTEQGRGLFAVARDAAEVRPYTIIDGSLAAEIALDDAVAVPMEGMRWTEALSEARLMAAAEAMGLASRLFDETLGYVRQRKQFGQPIGRFQAIQHRLVDCYVMLEQMRSTLWRAALLDHSDDWPREMAGAKAFICERAVLIGQEAIQLHGGMGVTDELSIGHAHKRTLLLSRLFGDPASELRHYASAG